MKLMDKYLLREYAVPVLYCLSAFVMMFVAADIIDNLSKFMESKVAPLLIGRYYLSYLLPNLEFLIPASLLLATLYTLWQFTRHNELTAFRASGTSFYRIMVPFLGVGLGFTLLSAALKEWVAPRAAMWAAEFADSRFTNPEANRVYYDRAYYNSFACRLWHIEEIDLRNPHRLIRVKVTQERANRSRERVMLADRAEYLDGQWWFTNLREQRFNAEDNPTGRMEPAAGGPQVAVEMRALTETPSTFVNEVKPWPFLSTREMVEYLEQRPDLTPERRAEKVFDIHRRVAMPWACLIVTLFAIPAGARGGRHSALSGIFLAIGLFFSFYVLMEVGVVLGKKQIVWPWFGAWLSNAVFLVAGLGMLLRMR